MVGKRDVGVSTRDRLLEVGVGAMLDGSYEATGIHALLARADVPKGSFYHHFKSKEQFAVEVARRYATLALERYAAHLEDASVAPLERLARLFGEMEGVLASDGYRRGCLLGNFAQEVSGSSEVLRAELERHFGEQREQVAACLRAAQAAGQLDTSRDADETADFLLSAWQGALVQMKVRKNAEPLRAFKSQVFGRLLKS